MFTISTAITTSVYTESTDKGDIHESTVRKKQKISWTVFWLIPLQHSSLSEHFFKRSVHNNFIYFNYFTIIYWNSYEFTKYDNNSTLCLFQIFRRLMDLCPGKVLSVKINLKALQAVSSVCYIYHWVYKIIALIK